jgi:mono/diheme cytochrome c family protein
VRTLDAHSMATATRTWLVVVTTCLAAVAAVSCSSRQLRSLSGADTFNVHCVQCHGARGEGDGPDAVSRNLAVPNLRTLARRNGGMFPVDAVASYIDGTAMPAAHGNRAMPVWGPVFDTTSQLLEGAESGRQRIDAVIDHLRTLQIE